MNNYLKKYRPAFRLLDSSITFNGIRFGEHFESLNRSLNIDKLKESENDSTRKFGLIGNEHITDLDSLSFIGFAGFLNNRLFSLRLESFSKYLSIERYFIDNYGMPHYSSDDALAWVGDNIKIILTDSKKSKNKNSSIGNVSVDIVLINFDAVDEYGKHLLNSSFEYKKKGKIDSALSYVNRYLEIYPNSANAYRIRGILKTISVVKDYQGAVIDFTKAIALDKNDKDAYLMRGLTYRALKLNSQACGDFKTASALGEPDANKFLKECANQ